MTTNAKFKEIPFEDIVKFGQKTLLNTDLFTVSWILGRFCNYNCSYCWPYARSDKPDHQPLEVYKQTIDIADRMYLTFIHTKIDNGHVFFPHFNFNDWKLISEDKRKKDDKHMYDYSFLIYDRVKA